MTPFNYPPNHCTKDRTHCPNCCEFSKGSLSSKFKCNQSAILFKQGNLHALTRARVGTLRSRLQYLQPTIHFIHAFKQSTKIPANIITELLFQFFN